MVAESEDCCRSCGKLTVLSEGLCRRCWDKKIVGPYSRRKGRKTFLPERPTYYVMCNGELVETSEREAWAVISGGRYYK